MTSVHIHLLVYMVQYSVTEVNAVCTGILTPLAAGRPAVLQHAMPSV